MKAKKSPIKKVLKKLEAVRATLPSDERKAFDRLIASNVTSEDEMQAHAASARKVTKAAASKFKSKAKANVASKSLDALGQGAAFPEDDDVQGHAAHAKLISGKVHSKKVLQKATTEGAAAKFDPVYVADDDEVRGHAAQRKSVADLAVASKFARKNIAQKEISKKDASLRISEDEVVANAFNPKVTKTKKGVKSAKLAAEKNDAIVTPIDDDVEGHLLKQKVHPSKFAQKKAEKAKLD